MSTPEGSRSSAKTVDPQFHFKGMEVWKLAGETHTEKGEAENEVQFKDRCCFPLKTKSLF